MLYAVKRIKKKISSESEGRLVVKESCALASLMSCPYMIRYFGCWIDDGHLHIQTEYCDKGSMDCYVLNSNARNSDLQIPDNRNLNINISSNRNDEDEDIEVNHGSDNDINLENENNNSNSQNNNNDNNIRDPKKSVDEIFTEKSYNTNFNEKQLFSVYENSQNDSLFDSQKDEMVDNDEKENKEFQGKTLEYNNKVNDRYNNNNDDNDDELFIKEDSDNDNYNYNQNMDINIDGIDISKVIKNDEFYSDIHKENNENNNNNKILSVCENDAQLRYSDAIFSAEEDSRNSDTYSCFSESNSNNYYDQKYNNKNEEFQKEIENSNYENRILRNNKNNQDTINQEKRSTKNINNSTLKDEYYEKNDIETVTEKDIRGEEGNHSREDNADRGDMIEVEKERAREEEGERERVRVGQGGGGGGQEEENRNADSEMPCGVVSEGLVWGILHSMGSALRYMHSRGDALCEV